MIFREDATSAGLARILNEKLGTSIKSSKPIDWQFYMGVATVAVSVLALGYVVVVNFSNFGLSRVTPIFVVVYTAFMCSGYMWNTIRKPPYMGRGERGEAQVFSGSQQHQFGVEPMIMTLLCMLYYFNVKTVVLHWFLDFCLG
jgi:oligosaccharyltransferase complex subunit gamma